MDDYDNADSGALLKLGRAARNAGDEIELGFIAVNGTLALAPYRQGALWIGGRGVLALSGVVQPEANVPYVQWLARLCPQLGAGPVDIGALDAAVGADWDEWLPRYALWLPLAGMGGGLLLARDIPWMERELAILGEWSDILAHSLRAHRKPARGAWHLLPPMLQTGTGKARWRRAALALALLALMLAPVRLTVLAQGELVPRDAAVIRAPLDGVIARFLVAPNQLVKKGQPLFEFDQGQLQSRYDVARQAQATAEAEYRQSAQLALSDSKPKGQLATLQGRIEERRSEADFVRSQVEKATVASPRDGIALYDNPEDWVGRPTVAGERVLRVAAPQDVEVEAWLPMGDAIPLVQGASARLYLAASPLDPVGASVRYVAYEAAQRPDGSYAYRVRASLTSSTAYRVGLKGTVKLEGERVPLIYWVLRRPLAAVRQFLGV